MSIDFLKQTASNGSVSNASQFLKELTILFEHAKRNGLSAKEQEAVINVALNVDMSDKILQNLILCMIPKKGISEDIIEEVLYWICGRLNVSEVEGIETKIISLLDWIVCLLNYRLVDKDIVYQFYPLLFTAVTKNWKSLCHLLCLLTKSEDVTSWRIYLIRDAINMWSGLAHHHAILKRFKELNPNFVYNTVPLRKTFEQIFSNNNVFHNSLKNNLSKRSPAFIELTTSVVMPFYNRENELNVIQRVILPPVQYFDSHASSDCLIHDIKNGHDMAKKFRKLTLPLNTLSLLNSSIGIHILMLSNSSIQEHFLQNLYGVLEEHLIMKPSKSPTNDVEKLLKRVVHLHQFYQQGFISVSRVLSKYIQSWDGHEYRSEVYALLKWFVFKSPKDLNRYILVPLHSLFISADPTEMAEILYCLQALVENLYFRMMKDAQMCFDIYEEGVLKTRDELIPVIKSLSEFTSDLCEIGLYAFPCNNLILTVSIAFYEKMHELETRSGPVLWTIISSNVLYHCIFSFNAQLLNQMCGLMLKYREMPLFSTHLQIAKIEDKKDRLRQYAADMFNILWTAKAFVNRMNGYIFTGLSKENEASWRRFANLNNSLTIDRHIMFTPYRLMAAMETNHSVYEFSKDDILRILQNKFPNFVTVLQHMVHEEEEMQDD